MAAASETVPGYVHPEEKLARLKQTERKQLWQWICELTVAALGLIAFVLLSFPGFTQHTDPLYRVEPAAAFPALVSLLLLFMTVSLREQWRLRKERNELLRPQLQGEEPAEAIEDPSTVAATDPVTELPNAPAATEWLTKQAAAARSSRKPLSLLLLRVDEFDKLYRRGGNALCEEALRRASERMRSATRGSDLAAHMGNGEFVLALPGCSLSETQHVQARVGSLEIRHGLQPLTLEYASASVDLQVGETPAECLQRGRELLRLYAELGAQGSPRVSA